MEQQPKNNSSRGRGTPENPPNRFERRAYLPILDSPHDEDGAVKTQYLKDASRSLLTTNDSPDVGFDASINPYRGCEHGCIYCYARPAHAYMGLSPGLDFESKLFFKPHAARLLESELSKPTYKPEFIHIGGNTDP